MPTGTVKFFNEQKGYGFIAPDDGSEDAFVHISAVERAGMGTLREKQRIGYDLEQDRRGKMAASNIRAADEPEQETAEIQGIADPATDESQPAGQA